MRVNQSLSKLQFPASSRLLDGEDYQRVYRRASRSSDSILTVSWRARPTNEAGARLGLAISKKCARRSVDRQRIKRIVRESFRLVRFTLPAVDIIVSCRNKAAGCTNDQLRISIEKHLKKLLMAQ